jgi:hypothetical protein
VRVTISPDNVASHQLASQYRFTEVGERWDGEDGLEIIYEVDAQRRWARKNLRTSAMRYVGTTR